MTSTLQTASSLTQSGVPDFVWQAILSLLAVGVGAAISYFFTVRTEKKRIEAQRLDLFNHDRREAIGLALEWIAPLDLALMKATSLATRPMRDDTPRQELVRGWPDPLKDLKEKDLPARLQYLLPKGMSRRAISLCLELDQLRLNWLAGGDPMTIGQSVDTLSEQLTQMSAELEADLHRSYGHGVSGGS
ncbi:MAG: hypothetical protein IT332_13045 [Ardenticatenales bacterium]|nr:hypothetical protein [Ardenticatenales bacterium]